MTSVVCIVGPTASGKSVLAEEVALRLDTSVVSVDAMQVYRGMDIGTAKTPVSQRRCPLLMVDVADVGEAYSVQLFQTHARACVDGLLRQGRVPVLCGGTGLYLDAVIDEMDFPAGQAASPTRQKYERMAQELGPEELHSYLAERDPQSAALIHPHNVRRVVRALEMLDEGRSYARQHAGLHQRAPHYPATIWGIQMDRERLYRRIDDRVDQMVAQGLVDEVQGLIDQGLEDALTALQAIGYQEVIDALRGRTSMDEAVAAIKQRTRRYAKRQISWFRHDGRVRWLDLDELSLTEARDRIVREAEA